MRQSLTRLLFEHLRAQWRLRWAESRHDGSQATVEQLKLQLGEALKRRAATGIDLKAAQGAASLASDRITWHRVRCGMGLR